MEISTVQEPRLLVVGISHETAPLDLLERLYESPRPLDDLVTAVSGNTDFGAAVVLSTCNRLEVYTDTAVDEDRGGALGAMIAEHTEVCLDDLAPHMYVHAGTDAARHLFRVASGLDSVVLGEDQILGQVREALERSQKLDCATRRLNQAVQTALRVGKRVRNETDLNEAGRSLATAGLAFFEQRIGSLDGKSALVVGAGSMGAVVVAALRQSGLSTVHMANRTPEKAQRLAETAGGSGFGLDGVPELLTEVDIVVCCTAATGPLITQEHVAKAMERRDGRRLFLLDLSLPRNIVPAAGDVSGAVLVDMQRIAEEGGDDELSAASVQSAHRIVDTEIERFHAAQRTARATPILTAMRTSAAEATASELDRLSRRLDSVDVRVRQEINQSVRRIVDKFLHLPTVRARQLADTPDGAMYVDALGKLFAPEAGASTTEEVLV